MKIKTEITSDEGTIVTVENSNVGSLSDAAELFSTALTGAWGYEVGATLSVEPDGPHFSRDGLVS